jgi:hypothetical protein
MKQYAVVFLMEDVEAEDKFEAADKALELLESKRVRKTMTVEEVRSDGSE